MKDYYDMDIAIELARHIDNPCIDPKTGENIRDFYIRMAMRCMPHIKNPYAILFLERKVKQYSVDGPERAP